MIYQDHPDVGAILHVHAWMEGIAATDINYPCGTAELAGASPSCSPPSPIPRTPSSACATTASPSPATA